MPKTGWLPSALAARRPYNARASLCRMWPLYLPGSTPFCVWENTIIYGQSGDRVVIWHQASTPVLGMYSSSSKIETVQYWTPQAQLFLWSLLKPVFRETETHYGFSLGASFDPVAFGSSPKGTAWPQPATISSSSSSSNSTCKVGYVVRSPYLWLASRSIAWNHRPSLVHPTLFAVPLQLLDQLAFCESNVPFTDGSVDVPLHGSHNLLGTQDIGIGFLSTCLPSA